MRRSGIFSSPQARCGDAVSVSRWLLFFALSLKLIWRLPLKRRSRAALPEAAGAVVFRIRCAWIRLRAARQSRLQSGVWPVRRPRSSITIATFPGRKARTVSRFNLFIPVGTHELARLRPFFGRLFRSDRRARWSRATLKVSAHQWRPLLVLR